MAIYTIFTFIYFIGDGVEGEHGGRGSTCTTACMWKAEGNLKKLLFDPLLVPYAL